MSAKGTPIHVQLTPGQQHESTVARDLLEYARGKFFLADTAYDSNDLIDAVREQDMKPVIHPRPNRKLHKLKLRRKIYRRRYVVEVFFHRLKNFRVVATRFEKTARNYLALIQLACTLITLTPN